MTIRATAPHNSVTFAGEIGLAAGGFDGTAARVHQIVATSQRTVREAPNGVAVRDLRALGRLRIAVREPRAIVRSAARTPPVVIRSQIDSSLIVRLWIAVREPRATGHLLTARAS